MDQLIKLFSDLTNRQRMSIGLAVLLIGGGVFGFVRWKRESDFRPLYTAMAPEDAAGVVQKLRETGVDYRLSDDGSAVSAPSAKLAEARLTLAAAGLPKTGRIGFELFDKTAFGATEFVEHINYERALEGELERTMMSLAEVEQARVHLTLPKESIFLDKQEPAKASVVLKLRPAARISQQNTLAITNLVAGAVQGLSPEGVSVVDIDGNLLNRPRRTGEAGASQFTAEALEVRQQLERDLVSKIHSTLEPLLGPDRFRAGASIDCDLTSGEQQEETFDPTKSVMVSSQKSDDVSERAAISSGVPGTASNLPASEPRPGGSGGGTTRHTENVAYQSSRIVRQTHIPQGVIRRMSLSVLVDHTVRWEGEGRARRRILEPPTPETLKTIKDLVAASTGFSAERGDQLIVETLPFEATLNTEPMEEGGFRGQPKAAPRSPAWLDALEKNRSLIALTVLGLIVAIFLLRTITRLLTRSKRKAPAQAPLALPDGVAAQAPAQNRAVADGHYAGLDAAATSLGLQAPELADRVRLFAQSDMKVAANVLRMWLQERQSRPI